MQNIWFSSDTHAYHKNICRGTTTWDLTRMGGSHVSTRDFDNEILMTEELIEKFNSLIKENDILYHLGDWSFGGHENIKIFRDRIKCKNIHLILGNHDQHIEPINSPYRKLFSSVSHKLEFSLKVDSLKSDKFGKQQFFLSHYSHQVWNKSHHGSIHLFGHSHGTLKGLGRSMDVGVDTHDLYPYHMDEILFIMKDIKSHTIDHHSESTT